MHDPTFWQPLALDQIVSQNGIAVPGRVQSFIGAQWGHVRGFALPPSKKGLPIDPGKPPFGTPETDAYKQAAVDVIRASAELDSNDRTTIDIGPGARGDNPLGTNNGDGYDVNPVTGKPYAANLVKRADFARIVTEFWADGPASETPPGHWNVLANAVSDSPLLASRIGPTAADRLKWDVRLYFALNGAVHDAAIAAWGIKRHYDGVRPISMIRYLAGKGQSTDPAGPSYDREGLPLVPGLIEVVTAASSAPGQRHAALAGHVGEIAVRSWRPKLGVGWELGVNWSTYQRATFVTPAFPGFVSGHSTFSRAAAEVMAGITGSPLLPRRPVRADLRAGVPEARARPERARDAPGGDVLRRCRPGRHLAHLRRDPHHGRRFRRPPGRLDRGQASLGARAAVLRRNSSAAAWLRLARSPW